ncbi:amino acid ABC transporter substrate-binding protein [Desulfitobacterium sp.]|uniref:amino acid ABC transporter substrate-binding protein n=1 Tax=Desulfitobacterium sp. TaxID=49981 RepID=UPI002BCF7F73|nr:amino acid ABC transporter substrate-binding protein [Desulfitobacterium sp.]HVJ48767.1 amino acid ABC transporter substrate-binding protein [Desulfitobacterium sp.]
MKKIFTSILLVVMSGLLLTGCGSTSTSGTAANTPAAPPKIIIGLDDNFPPMGFRDEQNKLVGFDIDLVTEAAKRLNMEVEFRPIDWNSKEVELNGKKVDALWNGLTITEERKKNIAFTQPYMANKQIIVVLPDSKVKTKADLAGKVVGAQDGSTSVDAMAKEPDVKNSFKELKLYGDNVAALIDLKAGRLDAVVVDEIVGRYYMTKKPGEYTLLTENFGTEDYGVGFRKDDTELLNKVQKALDEMKADGTSTKISEKWFNANVLK